MNKHDFFLILCISILCAGLFGFWYFQKEDAELIEITVNGAHFETLNLQEDCEILVNGGNKVVVSGGAVFMEQADCPDKLCVKQGKIRHHGESIVCLPNRVVVTVLGKREIDTVAG